MRKAQAFSSPQIRRLGIGVALAAALAGTGAARAELVILADGGVLKVKTYELDGEVTVGRSPGCSIATSYDVYSSTIHSRLFRSGNQLWVEDLGSTNGTYLNEELLDTPRPLHPGDHVRIGESEFVFEVD